MAHYTEGPQAPQTKTGGASVGKTKNSTYFRDPAQTAMANAARAALVGGTSILPKPTAEPDAPIVPSGPSGAASDLLFGFPTRTVLLGGAAAAIVLYFVFRKKGKA